MQSPETTKATEALLRTIEQTDTSTLLDLGDEAEAMADGLALADDEDTEQGAALLRAFGSLLWAQAEDRDKR